MRNSRAPSLCPAFLRSTNVTGESVGKTEAFGNLKRRKKCADGNNEGERIKRRENKGRQRKMALAPGEKGGMIVCRGGRDNKSLSFISSVRISEWATQYLCYYGTSESHPGVAPRAPLLPRSPQSDVPTETLLIWQKPPSRSPMLIDSFPAASGYQQCERERERERVSETFGFCLPCSGKEMRGRFLSMRPNDFLFGGSAARRKSTSVPSDRLRLERRGMGGGGVLLTRSCAIGPQSGG